MARKKSEGRREPKLLRVGVGGNGLGMHTFSVRSWIKRGKIQAGRVGLEARIPRTEIELLVGKADERLLVLYGRVSGQGQRDDLDTQVARLERWAKTERPGIRAVVLSDIGSGLSTTRRHLARLLKMVCEGPTGEVAITYADRLTRFGQDYLERLFESFGVRLTILEPEEEKTPEQELTQDLLTLIASFSGRLYGMRSHKQKELLQCAEAVINNP